MTEKRMSVEVCVDRVVFQNPINVILAGPALFRGRLRAFGKCTNGVALLKGRQNFHWHVLHFSSILAKFSLAGTG